MLGCVVVRDLEDSNSSIEPFPTDRNDSDCGWRRGGGGEGWIFVSSPLGKQNYHFYCYNPQVLVMGKKANMKRFRTSVALTH